MADNTAIEWTDATWNPITGCSVVSPGCTNCYAMGLAGTRLKHSPSRAGLTKPSKAGPVWNGQVRLNEQWLDQPLRWQRPRRIFVCAHGDLFHENVPDEWIDRVFAVMALAPQHTFQALTKRSARMRAWFDEKWQGTAALPEFDLPAGKPTGRDFQIEQATVALAEELGRIDVNNDDHWTADGTSKVLDAFRWPLSNVWLGVSVERQQEADQRIPDLLATPAAKRFLSCEPLLGPIDVRWAMEHPIGIAAGFQRLGHFSPGMETLRPLDWVIAGGESGKNARPMHPDWARSLRDQCTAAGVPFFFKQWGEFHRADGRMAPIPSVWIKPDGSCRDALTDDMCFGETARGWIKMERVGKKSAGATLDGREWREFPA